ncbi:hypothetical protein [Devosia sp. DBB001]|nr:hypothetical protein [Devosia sp. DBB001]
MPILEHVTFSIRVPIQDFLAANAQIDTWLAARPGFLFRHLARKDDGSWIDLVGWDSLDAAQAAAKALMEELMDAPAMQAIDPATIVMTHAQLHVAR